MVSQLLESGSWNQLDIPLFTETVLQERLSQGINDGGYVGILVRSATKVLKRAYGCLSEFETDR